MNQYGILQAIYMSFYSKKLYRDVALNWGGNTFFYLLIVIFLSWIAFTIQLQVALNAGFATYGQKFTDQTPVMTVTKGVLSTPEARPYIITSPDDNTRVAVIDTTGKYQNLVQANAPVLVTSHDIYSSEKPGETKINAIPANMTVQIVPTDIHQFLATFLGFSWVLVLPFLIICAFIYRFIEVFLYAIIGKIFSLIASRSLTYWQMVKVSTIAITPALLLATVLDALRIDINHQLGWYFLITMAYLLFGVLANIPNKQGE